MICIHIIISGDVQGHGFRSSAMYFANLHNIKGYAQYENRDKLTIVAQGDEKSITEFIEYCRGLSRPFGEPVISIHEAGPDDYHAFAIRNSKVIYQPGQKKQPGFIKVNIFYQKLINFFGKISANTNNNKTTITKGQTT